MQASTAPCCAVLRCTVLRLENVSSLLNPCNLSVFGKGIVIRESWCSNNSVGYSTMGLRYRCRFPDMMQSSSLNLLYYTASCGILLCDAIMLLSVLESIYVDCSL
jgi:hypothetical protein